MNKLVDFKGVVIPMVTPFTESLEIDFEAVERIINSFIQSGTFPFILGTTGEASLIPLATKMALVEMVGKVFSGKTTLFAGISATSLEETINNGKAFADLGIDAAVATPPNGYPLGVADQLRFFEQLADNIPIPLIVYNIPQTTHISIDLQVIEKFSHHQNIVGIKDSEVNAQRQEWSLNQWKDRKDFVYFSGSASTSEYSLMNGGSGIVPSAANLVPELYQKLYLAAKSGDAETARQYQKITDDITSIYAKGKMLYSSLPSLKGMMELTGLCSSVMMSPFEKVDSEEMYRLQTEIAGNPYLENLLISKNV